MRNKSVIYKTNYLLPICNFWVGLGSVINIAGNYFEFKYSKSEEEADRLALTSDWEVVGEDIRKASNSIKKELTLETK